MNKNIKDENFSKVASGDFIAAYTIIKTTFGTDNRGCPNQGEKEIVCTYTSLEKAVETLNRMSDIKRFEVNGNGEYTTAVEYAQGILYGALAKLKVSEYSIKLTKLKVTKK